MLYSGTLLLLTTLPVLAGVVRGEVVSVRGEGRPAFSPHQLTTVVAPLHHAATLHCAVLGLADKSVSWVRSRDLQILSHAGIVFTADARVSASSSESTESARTQTHSLRIENLRPSDAGRYECQVNTEPKMSLFFNLTVVDEVVPSVVVSALGSSAVAGEAGGAATLACEARYVPPPRRLPLAPLAVTWRRGGAVLSARGAVALDTERWEAPPRVVSRLTLADLRAEDAGEYVCSATGRAVTLHLRVEDHELSAEAMQRDESADSGSLRATPPTCMALVTLVTLVALVCR